MRAELISKIDEMIEEHTEALVRDTKKFVSIKSTEGESEPGAPFGRGPKLMLDTFLKMSKEEGFHTMDYGVGVVSAALKEGERHLGIWLHGDAVPEGDGWSYPPYSPTEYKGCIIGRGATDNKGQLAAIYNLFKIFKAMNIELKYNPAIYLGSNEETGMRDITGVPGNPDAKGFINVCKPPRLSLVPDGSFSIGYGGKGGLTVALRSNAPLRSLIFTAGGEDSPGRATAVLHRRDIPDSLPDCEVARGEATVVSAFSPPRHASNPDPNGNMITKLTSALLDGKLVNEDDTAILEFLKSVSLDIYGTQLGIAAEHGILGKLTVFSKTVDCIDGHVILTLNVRYPLGITYGEIIESIAREAEKASFTVHSASSGTEPYLNDPNSDIANALCTVANEITGENKAPYTISGSTYAHKLPNAYVYGMNGCNPPPDYPKGRGGAHGIDELVSIDRLKRAMRIYARALLTLDVMEW